MLDRYWTPEGKKFYKREDRAREFLLQLVPTKARNWEWWVRWSGDYCTGTATTAHAAKQEAVRAYRVAIGDPAQLGRPRKVKG